MNTKTEIEAGVKTYIAGLTALTEAYFTKKFPTLSAPLVTCTVRQKYAKIVKGGSTYSWIDLATGDILKGSSKGVDRGAAHIKRGNVCDGSWLNWHGPFGLGYADSHGEFRAMIDDATFMVATDAIKEGNAQGTYSVLAAALK